MRKIHFYQIVVFLILFVIALMFGIGTSNFLLGALELGDFRGIAVVAVALLCVYIYAFAIFRIFLWIMPLEEGEIKPRSRQEFIYHVYLLFFLILFYPIMRSGMMPVPLMRLVYLALGARLGNNTYSSGIILDPPFVQVGDNTLIGQYALIIPHVIENEKLAHHTVRIGNNVTIGAHAVVMSGVTIGDHALVATGAIVGKGKHIGAGEVWGGVPARRLSAEEGRDSC